MAELGQIIVNRVKPLLDEANSAGYETGYGNGFDSGYVSGEESVRGYVDTQVEISKKAIIGRGGDISSDAGLEDLPQAIFNIPADASLAHYTDGGIAYQKNVPVGAEKYALLKSVGGMTYKSNNLLPYPYIQTTKTVNGIVFTDNGDGSISVKGTATDNAVLYLTNAKIASLIAGKTYIPSTSASQTILMCNYIDNTGTTKNFTTSQIGARQYPNDVTLDQLYLLVLPGTTVDEIVYPMLNEGTTALPYEPYYEGLRDSKATEIVSVGANLIPYPYMDESYTLNGITFTVRDDGTITANGTATDQSYFILFKGVLPIGKYFLSGTPQDGLNGTQMYFTNGNYSVYKVDTGSGVAIDVTKAEAFDIVVNILKGTVVSNAVYKPILNYGTTAAPYVPYRDEPIATKPIPKALQDIEGYGWGINADCYNYVDWEKKQFVKRVERVDMGTLGWWETSGVVSRFGSPLEKLAKPTGSYNVAVNAICSAYPNITQNTLFANNTGVSIQALTANNVYVYDANYTDTTSFKAAMSGVMLYYELAEPIITDISDILTGDNFIEVESGGTLEFANEYKNAVPSTIKYTIKVGS